MRPVGRSATRRRLAACRRVAGRQRQARLPADGACPLARPLACREPRWHARLAAPPPRLGEARRRCPVPPAQQPARIPSTPTGTPTDTDADADTDADTDSTTGPDTDTNADRHGHGAATLTVTPMAMGFEAPVATHSYTRPRGDMAPATAMGATAQSAFATQPTDADPYRYQTGFGNRFASEAVPGVMPVGRNTPQSVKYGLYSEQLNGAPVVASRDALRHVWMYRMRPTVAHGRVVPSDANPHVRAALPLAEPACLSGRASLACCSPACLPLTPLSPVAGTPDRVVLLARQRPRRVCRLAGGLAPLSPAPPPRRGLARRASGLGPARRRRRRYRLCARHPHRRRPG